MIIAPMLGDVVAQKIECRSNFRWKLSTPAPPVLGGLRGMERGANLVDVRSVTPNRLMEGLAGNAKFLAPVSDVGGQLGIDDLWIVWTLGCSLLVWGMCAVFFGGLLVLVLGQSCSSFFG